LNSLDIIEKEYSEKLKSLKLQEVMESNSLKEKFANILNNSLDKKPNNSQIIEDFRERLKKLNEQKEIEKDNIKKESQKKINELKNNNKITMQELQRKEIELKLLKFQNQKEFKLLLDKEKEIKDLKQHLKKNIFKRISFNEEIHKEKKNNSRDNKKILKIEDKKLFKNQRNFLNRTQLMKRQSKDEIFKSIPKIIVSNLIEELKSNHNNSIKINETKIISLSNDIFKKLNETNYFKDLFNNPNINNNLNPEDVNNDLNLNENMKNLSFSITLDENLFNNNNINNEKINQNVTFFLNQTLNASEIQDTNYEVNNKNRNNSNISTDNNNSNLNNEQSSYQNIAYDKGDIKIKNNEGQKNSKKKINYDDKVLIGNVTVTLDIEVTKENDNLKNPTYFSNLKPIMLNTKKKHFKKKKNNDSSQIKMFNSQDPNYSVNNESQDISIDENEDLKENKDSDTTEEKPEENSKNFINENENNKSDVSPIKLDDISTKGVKTKKNDISEESNNSNKNQNKNENFEKSNFLSKINEEKFSKSHIEKFSISSLKNSQLGNDRLLYKKLHCIDDTHNDKKHFLMSDEKCKQLNSLYISIKDEFDYLENKVSIKNYKNFKRLL